jgi:hypothetical protein
VVFSWEVVEEGELEVGRKERKWRKKVVESNKQNRYYIIP